MPQEDLGPVRPHVRVHPRQYENQSSPLGETLARYHDFFALFESFSGYVDFFLLRDLVTDDRSAVTFFMPFDDFKTPSVPKDDDTYREYRRPSIKFIEAQNRRIHRVAVRSTLTTLP